MGMLLMISSQFAQNYLRVGELDAFTIDNLD